MGFFDRFLKKKSAPAETGAPDAAAEEAAPVPAAEPAPEPAAQGRTAHDWAILLAVNCLVLVASVALVAGRAYRHLIEDETPVVAAPPKPAPKAPAKEPEKPAETPAAPKEAPKAEAPKPQPKAEASKPKAPLPKPSLAAAAPKHAETKPMGGSAELPPVKSDKPRVSRPVSFKHEDPTAKEVDLLGMFLVRTGGRKRMFKDSKGIWRSTVYLNTGNSYDYKFEIVDGNGRKKTTATQTVTVP